MQSVLKVEHLELQIHLGWTAAEREVRQRVLLNIEFYFLELPKAALTDELNDTICYAAIENMLMKEVESAKSAAYYGMWCAAEMNDELASVASLAKAYCSEAYFHAAAENIQIHGGIGFTWEHPAHLYFKRAKSSELIFGDPTYHRELLATRIGI